MIKKYGLLISIVLFSITKTWAQDTETAKVLLAEISKSYKGDSKDGLANGKGTAKGVDTYTGEFKNGLPDGKGKYTYENGNVYNGYFTEGLKNGKGVFTFSIGGNTITQKGYWVKGDYVGINNPEELYIVSNQSGIESYSITKVEDSGNDITFSVISGGTKYVPRDFTIHTTSGQRLAEGKTLLITNYNLPVNCEISFSVNKSGNIMQCRFTFEILKPGRFKVELTIH
jgi:outer membrane lipoprotein-sorting protein